MSETLIGKINDLTTLLESVNTAGLASVVNTLGSPAGASLAADIAALKTVADLIKGYTDTEIGAIDTVVDAVKAVTDAIPDAGALTALLASIAAIKATTDVYPLGTKVTKAKADVLDGVQNALFTISGGRVMITSITLEVCDAAVDSETANTKLIFNPTVGTDTDMCAVADLNGAIVGTICGITGTVADALQVGKGIIPMMGKYLQLAEGTIDIKSSSDNANGGATVSAIVTYIPLDTGATIA